MSFRTQAGLLVTVMCVGAQVCARLYDLVLVDIVQGAHILSRAFTCVYECKSPSLWTLRSVFMTCIDF